MSNIYTPANARFYIVLENSNTTLHHDLDCAITSNSLLDELTDAYGDIHYTIPTGTVNPTVADVVGVHFHDHSGCIVAERTRLKGLNVAELQLMVREMLASLVCHEYQVTIETTRLIDGWETSTDSISTVKACHPLAAITEAYRSLMVDLTRVLTTGEWQCAIGYDHIDNLARDLDAITHTVGDNTYTLKAIKRVEYVPTLYSI